MSSAILPEAEGWHVSSLVRLLMHAAAIVRAMKSLCHGVFVPPRTLLKSHGMQPLIRSWQFAS